MDPFSKMIGIFKQSRYRVTVKVSWLGGVQSYNENVGILDWLHTVNVKNAKLISDCTMVKKFNPSVSFFFQRELFVLHPRVK